MPSTNITYPSTRRRGPFQSVPKSAHKASASMSSIASSITSGTCASRSTCTSQDIVARILAQDEIPRGTFLASEAEKKKQTQGNPYPERLDSRRALLSVFNGSKAPFVFKGPSFGVDRELKSDAIIPTRSTAVYLHKELPPTPKSAPPRSPIPCQPVPSSNTLPPVRPLNLNFKRSPAECQPKGVIPTTTTAQSTSTATLASKRLSRAVRAVPAPIRPPPQLRGIAALNGPSSAATTSDEQEEGKGIQTQALKAGTMRVLRQEDILPENTPMEDLPITPLDIPVDWDDLHECWTSPILGYLEDEGEEKDRKESASFGLNVDDKLALQTFQQEVAGLFATTPNGSIGESGEQLDLSSGTPSPCSDASVTREKRHGRMLVTKQLKLCLDASVVQFDKHQKSHRASSGPQYKAGESFLTMTSPLTPCGASVGLRTSTLLDAYSYVS